MKFRYILIVSLILATLMVSTVSADDTVSQDIISDNDDNTLETIENEIYTKTDTTKTFSDLDDDILNSSGTLNIGCNYKFNSTSDRSDGIYIDKEDIVINGNGYTIDANSQSAIFIIEVNVTINNLTFKNANSSLGSVFKISPGCSVTTNNVIFENNAANLGAIFVQGQYTSNNDKFIDTTSSQFGAVTIYKDAVGIFNNATMASSKQLDWGFIYAFDNARLYVANSTFANTTSRYSTAIYGNRVTIIENSKFINLHSNISAGAIGVKCGIEINIDLVLINNCTFVNVTSVKNGGAIITDVYNRTIITPVIINNTKFIDCYSGFAGAIMQFGGNLTLDNCTFTNNSALYDGGALYTSYAIVNIFNSTFDKNQVHYNGGDRPTYGGTIFCDMGDLNLIDSTITNSQAQTGAVYLYDSKYHIANTIFGNNSLTNGSYGDIYTVFDKNTGILENNVYSDNNTLSLNNKIYETIIDAVGMKLVLINNTINVTTLPSKFDLRDWKWVTPIKNQGSMGACWAFGASAAIESAILRYLGLEIDISENNMQDTSLQYYPYGTIGMFEGGSIMTGAFYALSWFGVFSSQNDTYDELGKISPIICADNSIHIQDVVFIPARKNSTDNTALKEALLKYGALGVSYFAAQVAPYYNEATASQYCNETLPLNHGVTLIGWDDTYSASNFLITPPGDGAWIFKNSWGVNQGKDGYFYISYYDKTFCTEMPSVGFILENTVEYNMNYQQDLGGQLEFYPSTEYMNKFIAVNDDLIAGVGTYFNESGKEYIVEIYVNDDLKLQQKGISPYFGFHTIQLDSFIPIKKGDIFSVKITSNTVPLFNESRQHYIAGLSQYKVNGAWVNASDSNKICSIKVYTVADDTKIINNENITVDYGSGSYFSVKVVTDDGHAVGAGAVVNFTIKGKTISVLTDSNGTAKIKITQKAGTYVITTTYNGKTYNNTITVKPVADKVVIKAKKATVKRTAKKLKLKASLKINGKVAKGKKITFKFNGKTYKAKTNKKGIAKVTIKKNVIKKLKAGKTYAVKVSYLKNTIKTTVKVKK